MSLNQVEGRNDILSSRFLVSWLGCVLFRNWACQANTLYTVNPLERPPVVLVSRVKSSDKKEVSGKEVYKRVKTWPISELRTVDGRSSDGSEFELQFERQVYKWVASSVAEKKNFITAIYKVLCMYSCVIETFTWCLPS